MAEGLSVAVLIGGAAVNRPLVTVDALLAALGDAGLRPLPVLADTLQEAAEALARLPAADVVLDASDLDGSPWNTVAVPILKPDALAATPAAAGGLTVNVILPELHGRVIRHAADCRPASSLPSLAALAARWARLQRRLPAERRLAFVLAEPHSDPQRAAAVLDLMRVLASAGYRVEDLPQDAPALLARLAVAGGRHSASETMPLPDYYGFAHSLPAALLERVGERWGPPEQDPDFRPGELHCGEFAVPAIRFGNIAVGIQKRFRHDLDGMPADDSDLAPPHRELAFHAWLDDGFRADAVVALDAPLGRRPSEASA